MIERYKRWFIFYDICDAKPFVTAINEPSNYISVETNELNLREDGSVSEPLSLFEEIIISFSYHLFELLTNIVVDSLYVRMLW